MSPIVLILIILLIVVAFGGFGGYRYGWYGPGYGGYYGFGIVGVIIVVLLILLLLGRLRCRSLSVDGATEAELRWRPVCFLVFRRLTAAYATELAGNLSGRCPWKGGRFSSAAVRLSEALI